MTIAVDLGRKATKQTNKQTLMVYLFDRVSGLIISGWWCVAVTNINVLFI